MDSLYIVGAGGFAREIYSYLSKKDFTYNGIELKGFLSDNPNDLDGFNCKHPIVGDIRNNKIPLSSGLIMGVASCDFKQELYEYYRDNGNTFITYVHETAFVGRNVLLGEGTVICPLAVITSDSSLGKCNTVNVCSSIGHDVNIGDFSTLSGHCDITGGVKVHNNVFMGSHAMVIPGKVLEAGAIIGAGSVVIKKVKAGTTVFGNPAKKIF